MPGTTFLGKAETVSDDVVRKPVSFASDDQTLRGWLYLPSIVPAGMKASRNRNRQCDDWRQRNQSA